RSRARARDAAADAARDDRHPPGGGAVDDGPPSVGWIVPVNGPAALQTFRLDRRTMIGAAGDCQVRIDDPYMSGHHAQILLIAGEYVLVDAGAANGVVFGKQRVERHLLIDNDLSPAGRQISSSRRFSTDPSPMSECSISIAGPANRRHTSRRPLFPRQLIAL